MLQSELKQNLQGDRSNNFAGNQANEAINQYEQDFYAWTQEQSELLRLGQWQALDVENLVKEILSLGRQQKQELRDRLGILIGHLLQKGFRQGINLVLRGASLDIDDLPSTCPYAIAQILDLQFPFE